MDRRETIKDPRTIKDIQHQNEEEGDIPTETTLAQTDQYIFNIPIDLHGPDSMKINPQSQLQPLQLHSGTKHQQVRPSFAVRERGLGRGPPRNETTLSNQIIYRDNEAFILAHNYQLVHVQDQTVKLRPGAILKKFSQDMQL